MTVSAKVASDRSSWVTGLSVAIALLALVAASLGLFWQDGSSPGLFTTVYGQTVSLYGQGLYRYDTVFSGAGGRGTDAVTLLLGIPLLLIALWRYRQGSLRGTLLLVGVLFYFLYVYAGFALGTVTFNPLFLLYVGLFSASFFAFVLAFTTINLRHLAGHFSPHFPRRAPAIFMIVSGLFTLVIWLSPLLIGLGQGQPPETLGTYYTGRVTDALDLAIIAPSALIAAGLILRHAPLGYLMALSLLMLEMMLLPLIVAQTAFQVAAGVSFAAGEILGPILGFATLGLSALWVTYNILRHISEPS